MEDFFVMMLIVWAVGILSIILFFKLWRMTNDIKKICISVVKEPQRGRNWMVSTMLMKGESPEMISKYLIESFSEDIIDYTKLDIRNRRLPNMQTQKSPNIKSYMS